MTEKEMTVEAGKFVYQFAAGDLVVPGTVKEVTVEFQIIANDNPSGGDYTSKEGTFILERKLKDLMP